MRLTIASGRSHAAAEAASARSKYSAGPAMLGAALYWLATEHPTIIRPVSRLAQVGARSASPSHLPHDLGQVTTNPYCQNNSAGLVSRFRRAMDFVPLLDLYFLSFRLMFSQLYFFPLI